MDTTAVLEAAMTTNRHCYFELLPDEARHTVRLIEVLYAPITYSNANIHKDDRRDIARLLKKLLIPSPRKTRVDSQMLCVSMSQAQDEEIVLVIRRVLTPGYIRSNTRMAAARLLDKLYACEYAPLVLPSIPSTSARVHPDARMSAALKRIVPSASSVLTCYCILSGCYVIHKAHMWAELNVRLACPPSHALVCMQSRLVALLRVKHDCVHVARILSWKLTGQVRYIILDAPLGRYITLLQWIVCAVCACNLPTTNSQWIRLYGP
jgi:hypothetical protein